MQLKLCRVCGSRLDERIRTRGRHWNCELDGWQIERDTRVMGDRHLISTGVRWARCRCGAWTLAAISEGEPVAIDPPMVDEVAELTGLLNGRRSFDLIRVSGRTELMRRDTSRQRTREYPVALSHPCGLPVSVDDPIDNWKKKKPTPNTQKGRPAQLSETVAAQPPPF